MMTEKVVCDICGREEETGPAIVGWISVLEMALASSSFHPDPKQFCSQVCFHIGAVTWQQTQFRNERAPRAPLISTAAQTTKQPLPLGQYL